MCCASGLRRFCGVRLAAARRTTRCRRSCAAHLDYVPPHSVIYGYYLAEPIIALASTTTFSFCSSARTVADISRDFFVTGLAAGILILILGAPFVLVIIGMIVMAWVRFRRSQPLAAVCLIAGLFLAYGPWPVRNYFHLGRPLPFTMEGGEILFQGVYLAADDAQSFVELRRRPEFAGIEPICRTLPPLEEYAYWQQWPLRRSGAIRLASHFPIVRKTIRFWVDLPNFTWIPRWKTALAAAITLPLAVIGAWVTRGQIFTQVAVLWVTGLWMFYGIVR